MSLFGETKEVLVNSVVYNLAGPEENRPNYLKSLVVGTVLSGTKNSFADTFQRGYLNGPAIKFRNFYNWAANSANYGEVGLPVGELRSSNAVNMGAVEGQLTTTLGYSVWVQRAIVGEADYGLWVEQWLLANNPSAIGTAWTADINSDSTLITITYADTTTSTFVPADFDKTEQYIYAWYNRVTGTIVGSVVTGSTITLGTDPFPSTSGYTFESESTVGVVTTWIYSKMVYIGVDDDGSEYRRDTLRLVEDAGPPVNRSYRIDTQSYIGLNHQPVQLFIYQIGSGNAALDALVSPAESFGQFFPFIPVRMDNSFVSESYYGSSYPQIKKAYRKATGSRLEQLIEKLEDNPDLEDIDFAYVVFGVSLNVLDNSCKRYLYKFFQKLQDNQVGGPSIYSLWKTAMEEEDITTIQWLAWKEAQSDDLDPLYGTAEPLRPNLPTLPGNMIQVAGNGTGVTSTYDMRIHWLYIDNGSGTGPGKVGAKKGDLWFEVLAPDEFVAQAYQSGTIAVADDIKIDRIRLYWQTTDNTYTYLDIVGMFHKNYVYDGKSVTITAADALIDTDESGFIVPLHYDTWRETSLVHASQMGTACVFIVMNCYEVKKQKWYESWVFQIIIVIVIAIASVVLTGGAGLGLLGTHMSVGSALGFSGMTAAIVGSIANAMAALVLTTIIQKFSTAVFGEALGGLIAALTMMLIGSFSGALQNGGSLALNWGDLLKVENLMALTNALGNGIAGQINSGTMALAEKAQDYAKNAKDESEKIQQAFFENFGYGSGKIDPTMFVEASKILNESSDTFLTRTLLTGSDIAELSKDLLNSFAEYSLKLPDFNTA